MTNPKTRRKNPKSWKRRTKVGRLFITPKLLRNSIKVETNKIDKAKPEKIQAEESSPPLSREWILREKKIPPLNTKSIKKVSKVPKKEASILLSSCARQSLQGEKTKSPIINPKCSFDLSLNKISLLNYLLPF